MYQIFIAEDEPAAMKHLCTLVKLKCPQFEIIGCADNGKEALEQMDTLQPDVLITDVKMPVMDGISLVEKVKEKYPRIFSVIISGYQEFDYARAAIRAGVCDYILKPVRPSTFQESMRILQGRLDELYYTIRNDMLQQMCRGTGLKEKQYFRRVFSSETYYVALLRKNSLPRRFVNSRETEIFSIKNEQMMVYGRDEREALYICPRELIFHSSFYQLLQHILEKEKRTAAYLTLVWNEDPVPAEELPQKIPCLYQELDSSLIIGRDQILSLKDQRENIQAGEGELEHLKILLKEGNRAKALEEVEKCFHLWEAQEVTQLWVEDKVREVCGLFRKYHMLEESVEMCEYFMDEAFYYAENMQDLRENMLQIFSRNTEEEARRIKIDTPEFFEKITCYMRENLTEPLSPRRICQVFGISQTYLSRLFRKYSPQSFSKTLNVMRVEKACEIMKEPGNYFIKDIASMAGYGDQFYFSRIFRSLTGISPSEYIEQNR